MPALCGDPAVRGPSRLPLAIVGDFFPIVVAGAEDKPFDDSHTRFPTGPTLPRGKRKNNDFAGVWQKGGVAREEAGTNTGWVGVCGDLRGLFLSGVGGAPLGFEKKSGGGERAGERETPFKFIGQRKKEHFRRCPEFCPRHVDDITDGCLPRV